MLLNARRFASPGSSTPKLILLAIEDITERRQREAALQDSEVRYRRLFETAKDGILILDADTGKIIDANPFMTDLLGYSTATSSWARNCGRSACSRTSRRTRPLSESCRRRATSATSTCRCRTSDGERAEVEFVSNVYQEDHRLVAQCNIRDITERSRLEQTDTGAGGGAGRPVTAARTSSWRCSPTSFATRSPPSSTPRTSCASKSAAARTSSSSRPARSSSVRWRNLTRWSTTCWRSRASSTQGFASTERPWTCARPFGTRWRRPPRSSRGRITS